MGRGDGSKDEALSFRVEHKRFVTGLTCPSCGVSRKLLRLETALRGRRCSRCRRPMVVSGFGINDRIETGALPRKSLALTLRDLGLQPGDVYTVAGSSGESHFEVAL